MVPPRSLTPDEPMRQHLFAKFGVDLTAVEGVSIQTVLAFLSEVGTDVGKFATAEHFGSWLGLCPDNRITGGRTLAAHTRKVSNRLATALRMAAQSFHRSKSSLGDWFRRIRAQAWDQSRRYRCRTQTDPHPSRHGQTLHPLRPRLPRQSRSKSRKKRTLPAPSGRATWVHLDSGRGGSFIRVSQFAVRGFLL